MVLDAILVIFTTPDRSSACHDFTPQSIPFFYANMVQRMPGTKVGHGSMYTSHSASALIMRIRTFLAPWAIWSHLEIKTWQTPSWRIFIYIQHLSRFKTSRSSFADTFDTGVYLLLQHPNYWISRPKLHIPPRTLPKIYPRTTPILFRMKEVITLDLQGQENKQG